MNCNQPNNPFNIGQPGQLLAGCLTIYEPVGADSILMFGAAEPPVILDISDTVPYVTTAGGVLEVNVPAGTYMAQASVVQEHQSADLCEVGYNIKRNENGIITICGDSNRIASMDGNAGFYLQNHINTEEFVMTTAGVVYLAYGKFQAEPLECTYAYLSIIKLL